ncbi:hypothetical protein [Embleya sp. NPDC005575]
MEVEAVADGFVGTLLTAPTATVITRRVCRAEDCTVDAGRRPAGVIR